MWQLYDDLINEIPKDIIVEDIVVGEYHTLVKTNIGCGIGRAYPEDTRPSEFIGGYKGRYLREVASCIKSWNFTEAGIGLAAINSYFNSEEYVSNQNIKLNKNNFMEYRKNDPFISYQNDIRGKKVAVVGHFHYVEQLFAPVCDLSVIESEDIKGDFPETAASYILPQQNFVILPCFALQIKTLPWYLELCKNAYVVLVGPATPTAPVLFKYGINDLSGFIINDSKKAFDIISGNELNSLFYGTGQKISLKNGRDI